jgi:hypothetical protein
MITCFKLDSLELGKTCLQPGGCLMNFALKQLGQTAPGDADSVVES